MTTEKLRIIVTHWVLIWKLCHNYYNLVGAVVTNTEDLSFLLAVVGLPKIRLCSKTVHINNKNVRNLLAMLQLSLWCNLRNFQHIDLFFWPEEKRNAVVISMVIGQCVRIFCCMFIVKFWQKFIGKFCYICFRNFPCTVARKFWQKFCCDDIVHFC